MDRNSKLINTTLEHTLNLLHHTLPQVLEKGKTIQEADVDGYLIDTLFFLAVSARWIEIPTYPVPPNLQYLLKPQFKRSSPVGTVKLGGMDVPEKIHDEFISLFWHNQPEWQAQLEARLDEAIAALDSGDDPLADLQGIGAQRQEAPSSAILHASDVQITKRSPAQVLIDGKETLGITWEELTALASEQLQAMADEKTKSLGNVRGKVTVELKSDSIYRLLRGKNVRPYNAKALAAAIGVEWKLLIWPKVKTRRKAKRKTQVKLK
jgi:hypothetical protein